VAKSKSTCWGIAKRSIRSTDHVTRNDRYDQQFHDKGDNGIQCYSRGDDGIWYYPRGDDGKRWSTIV